MYNDKSIKGIASMQQKMLFKISRFLHFRFSWLELSGFYFQVPLFYHMTIPLCHYIVLNSDALWVFKVVATAFTTNIFLHIDGTVSSKNLAFKSTVAKSVQPTYFCTLLAHFHVDGLYCHYNVLNMLCE